MERLHQRLEGLLVDALASHCVRVHPQAERRVGVSQLSHDVHRILPEREQKRGERVAQLVGRQTVRQRYQVVALELRPTPVQLQLLVAALAAARDQPGAGLPAIAAVFDSLGQDQVAGAVDRSLGAA